MSLFVEKRIGGEETGGICLEYVYSSRMWRAQYEADWPLLNQDKEITWPNLSSVSPNSNCKHLIVTGISGRITVTTLSTSCTQTLLWFSQHIWQVQSRGSPRLFDWLPGDELCCHWPGTRHVWETWHVAPEMQRPLNTLVRGTFKWSCSLLTLGSLSRGQVWRCVYRVYYTQGL